MAGTIIITDTAKRNIGDSINELDAAGLAGSNTTLQAGTALTLHTVQIQLDISANVSKQPVPSKMRTRTDGTDTADNTQKRQYSHGTVDCASMNNPVWTFSGSLDLTTSTGQIQYASLTRLAKTKGYKTITGTHEMLLYYGYQERNNSTEGAGINVRVESVVFPYRPDTSVNRLGFTITCVET